jgi:hypothetical protein
MSQRGAMRAQSGAESPPQSDKPSLAVFSPALAQLLGPTVPHYELLRRVGGKGDARAEGGR